MEKGNFLLYYVRVSQLCGMYTSDKIREWDVYVFFMFSEIDIKDSFFWT